MLRNKISKYPNGSTSALQPHKPGHCYKPRPSSGAESYSCTFLCSILLPDFNILKLYAVWSTNRDKISFLAPCFLWKLEKNLASHRKPFTVSLQNCFRNDDIHNWSQLLPWAFVVISDVAYADTRNMVWRGSKDLLLIVLVLLLSQNHWDLPFELGSAERKPQILNLKARDNWEKKMFQMVVCILVSTERLEQRLHWNKIIAQGVDVFLHALIRHQSSLEMVWIACLPDIWQKSPGDVEVLHLFMAKDGLQKNIFTCLLKITWSYICFFARYQVPYQELLHTF